MARQPSITLNEITAIENLNHPKDFHIYFPGGSITFNVDNAPLRFWYRGESIVLSSEQDALKLKDFLLEVKQNPEAYWDDFGRTKASTE